MCVFNALLTQKIITTVYKNRKVKREKKQEKEKRIKPTHTARQYNSLKQIIIRVEIRLCRYDVFKYEFDKKV